MLPHLLPPISLQYFSLSFFISGFMKRRSSQLIFVYVIFQPNALNQTIIVHDAMRCKAMMMMMIASIIATE